MTALPVFQDFGEDFLRDLARRLYPVVMDRGERLFAQGDEARGMYIVISGELKITIRNKEGYEVVVKHMGPGEPVGEMALLSGCTRSATVTAVNDTTLAKLAREDFEELLQDYPQVREKLYGLVRRRVQRTILANLLPNYFGEMEAGSFGDIVSKFEWIHLKRGQALFKDGDTGDSLYILVNGLLHVVDELDEISGRPRPRKLLGVIYAGQMVGEMAVITGDKRMATIYAARGSDLVELSRESFEWVSRKYPQVLLAITRTVVRRLQLVGQEARPKRMALNIAVIPASLEVDARDLIEPLTRAFSRFGPVHVLTSDGVDAFFGREGIAQASVRDPRHPGICAWLEELESRHEVLIYQADMGPTRWTQHCLSRADKVVLAADTRYTKHLGTIETQMMDAGDPALSPARVLVLMHPAGTRLPSGTAPWLKGRTLEAHYHVRRDREGDFQRLARILSGRAVGLALGGGAARGLAHVGVLRALDEAGIPIDMVCGASMGAIIGALYALGNDYDGMMRICKKLFLEINPFSEYTLPVISLMRGRRLRLMGQVAYGDSSIEDLWLNFFCVSTNLTTSRLVVHRSGSLWRAVRTSSSVPAMIAPVLRKGQVYVDGGVINNLPGDILRPRCGRLIAVDANPSLDLSAGVKTLPSPWKYAWNRMVPLKKSIPVPHIVDIILSTVLTGSYMGAERVKEQADLSLTPPLQEIGFLSFKKLEQIVDIGYRYTREYLENPENQERIHLLKGGD